MKRHLRRVAARLLFQPQVAVQRLVLNPPVQRCALVRPRPALSPPAACCRGLRLHLRCTSRASTGSFDAIAMSLTPEPSLPAKTLPPISSPIKSGNRIVIIRNARLLHSLQVLAPGDQQHLMHRSSSYRADENLLQRRLYQLEFEDLRMTCRRMQQRLPIRTVAQFELGAPGNSRSSVIDGSVRNDASPSYSTTTRLRA